MFANQANQTKALPRWLVLTISIFFIGPHLFTILIRVLSATSGPWWLPEIGPTPAEAPFFAGILNNATQVYLKPLHMTHDYHFNANRTRTPMVSFQVKLKDKDGNLIEVLEFPDRRVNPWVRHRQELLAQNLSDDQPFRAPQGVVIPAPGKSVPEVTIWDQDRPDTLRLKTFSLNDKSLKERPQIFRPSKWSQVLAHSYVRFLCRQHNAAKGELVRLSRDPVSPVIMITGQVPEDFDRSEMKSDFGEYTP